MATSTIKRPRHDHVESAVSQISFKGTAANTWERAGSFTLSSGTFVYIMSSYSVRTTGLGFGGSTITTTPGSGYIEGSNHIYKTPLFWLNAGTHYLWVKTQTVSASNNYNIYKVV